MDCYVREPIICAKIEGDLLEQVSFNGLCSYLGKLWAARPGASDGRNDDVSMLGLTIYSLARLAVDVYKCLFNSLPDGLALVFANHPVAAPYKALC